MRAPPASEYDCTGFRYILMKGHAATMEGFGDKVGFIWSVADLLRGDYKPSEYGRVILPLVTLRRLDCVLAPTKEAVLAEYDAWKDRVQNLDPLLNRAARQQFYNISKLDFPKLLADPSH